MPREEDGASADALTDFGYERVPRGVKKERVREGFDSVAPRYDLMNDVMSLGLHRLWKRFAIAHSGLRAGQRALDVAAGSGDLSIGLARRVGATGQVIVTDINARMLAAGRDRLLDAGIAGNVAYVQADAEALPFAANSFHRIIMVDAFHHLLDQSTAAQELWRTLKPGGIIVIEEPDIRTFIVKLVALAEKVILMRSRFLSPTRIVKMFSQQESRTQVVREGFNAWIVIEKSSEAV